MEKIILPLTSGIGVADGKKLCVSIIDENGNKRVGGSRIKACDKLWKLPFLRAYTYFVYCFVFYFKALFLQEELGLEKVSKSKKEKTAEKASRASRIILALSILLAIFIVGFLGVGLLPAKAFEWLFEEFYDYYLRAFIIAIFRLILLYAVFVVLRFLPFMQSFYAFNGAGNLYMSGKGERMKEINYPLNFINLCLNVFAFSTFVISLVAINVSFLVNAIINFAIIALILPILFELLKLASTGKINWLKGLALVTNWLVYIKPNTTHNEVLLVAKREMENFDEFVKTDKAEIAMSALYAEMMTKLKAQDRMEESDIDWIIGTVLNKNRAEIKLQRSVTSKEYRECMRACERRAKGEPLSNIFGFVEFYGLRFDVNKKVLSPRMDTEILVEEVIKKAREIDAENILDLCTGSGAIGVALAKYTSCKVSACDISKQALAVAEQNAKKNEAKIEFFHSDLTKGLKKSRKYDIIVSNPPYIKSGDIEKLDVEVKKYDPRLALDGGEDGLDFYRRIVEEVPRKLAKKGWLYLEVGKGQSDDVATLLQENGFDNVGTIKDYNKIERVVYGRISK
ncbi:MAG: peptide chain release factor N(5)-glutamine methyltransferase [Clostridia bacterium]|nr:peptide chain release factor N(5)-glutamine methyltransferase [Clostridia bacterium]